jgi:hypothetical protein
MKKYNNKSNKVSDWTTKYIRDYAVGMYECIYGDNSCYSVSDLKLLDLMERELIKRGYNLKEISQLVITK